MLNVGWKDCDRVPWRNVKISNFIHWEFNKEKSEIEDKQLANPGASIYKVCSYKAKVWLKERYMNITFGYGVIYLESASIYYLIDCIVTSNLTFVTIYIYPYLTNI